MKTIVIDIGGTNFRIGIFQNSHVVGVVERFKTPNFINNPHLPIEKLQDLLIDTLIEKINVYRRNDTGVDAVAISFPAAMTNKGVTHKVPTIWGEFGEGYPLLETIQRKLPNTKLVIVNDLTAAVERYGRMEKYKSIDYLCVVTVSSGIGNKVYDVRNVRVILDKEGIGGELGHVQFDISREGPRCDCGGVGHIACFSSGRAVERIMKKTSTDFPEKFHDSILQTFCTNPQEISNYEIVKAAKFGDKYTLEILDKTTYPLVYSMGYLSGAIGVGKFVFIGGFALNLGQAYLNSLKRNLRKVEFFSRKPEEIDNLVDLGINDDNDCLVGVGLLAESKFNK